jgi:tRNA modification GTPase|tara:strand:- start:126742 stop:128034 length:1293 start_codon:yes stop_codon:yes gene_type:complete
MSEDTIFALATGTLPCAVAIVRISGPDAAAAVSGLLSGQGLPPARRASLRTLRIDGGELLDEALILVFPAPNSFTGEDVIELQVTGSVALVAKLLKELARVPDCRMAAPGEFARRAFLNGRIDLTEAEGLAALIDAETEAQRTQAMMAANGTLRARAEQWRGELLSIRADLEAVLDFGEAEDDVGETVVGEVAQRIDALREDMGKVVARSESARRIRRGVDIAIIGSPNAGKSSLVNMLSQSDAAIVSEIAGTTRDVIEVPLDIGGYRATLIDTAGLRETSDEIEAEGVRRARQRAANADIRIHLLLPEEHAPGGSDIIVRSKADVDDGLPKDSIHVSAVTGQGLDALLDDITARISGCVNKGDLMTVSARQASELASTEAELVLAQSTADPVLSAEHLRKAAEALGVLTGHVTSEDVLGQIFSRFCIGK